ncbi:hypothetical protein [Streptomyces sp. NBC_00354]|uniref:hypothetical protein n=1 Tax=Streptomyces sp. NBC_00354 TaxID=2975723 RepID=UPI002E2644DD
MTPVSGLRGNVQAAHQHALGGQVTLDELEHLVLREALCEGCAGVGDSAGQYDRAAEGVRGVEQPLSAAVDLDVLPERVVVRPGGQGVVDPL